MRAKMKRFGALLVCLATMTGLLTVGAAAAPAGAVLADGNYYVDTVLYKESENEPSMGDVAFANNRKALVTVENGSVTTVQVGTNPVDVSASNVTYHSGITKIRIGGSEITPDLSGSLTTKPAEQDYQYVRSFSFAMPASGQPDSADAVTFVSVEFIVPDTPMDSVVLTDSNTYLQARLRFDWSTATETSDTVLAPNDTTAKGTSSLSGETVADVELTDKGTGILLSTTTEGLSASAVLSVSKPTSGTDYDNAVKAMANVSGSWSLYKITAQVNGTEVAPAGSVTLAIPCTSAGLSVYRVSDEGTRATIKGTVKDGYYVISTSRLGLFAVVGQVSEKPLQEDITDAATGIRLTAAGDVLPDGATLQVSAVTSGADYTAAQTALAGKATKFAVYSISSQAAPTGTFTLSFPIPTDYATKRMAVYRLENGKVTELTGAVSITGKTYTLETSRLGTFVTVEKKASVLDAFTDVSSHWAKDYIEVAVERGLFSGTSSTTFSPDTSMTRGMFVTVLGRLAGVSATNGQTQFADVAANAYYAPYVAWAAENGIVYGTSTTTFSPETAINRQEMAVLLSRYCSFAGITLEQGQKVTFSDQAKIDSFAAEAVQDMAAAGLLTGSNGAFNPKSTATRAEVATVLARFIQGYGL